MKVITGHNPYNNFQSKRNVAKQSGFADMYSDTSVRKDSSTFTEFAGETGSEAQKDNKEIRALHDTTFYRGIGHRFRQLHPSKEWLNTVGQPNAESKGDKDLTGPQILFLQTNYDIENLTPEARRNLLCDLTDMGVLSASDINSDDQSKVDDVFEKIKAFKMGVATYVELPEQPEVIISDGSDPELRGLSDDEKYAAIVKKYEGGTTLYSFSLMVSALYSDKLITREQADLLHTLSRCDYTERRFATERSQGSSFNLDLFNMNYRVTMDNLLEEATKLKNYTGLDGQPRKIDEAFLKEFASKYKALS